MRGALPAGEGDERLVDGTTVHLRPIRADDQERHARFAARLSPESQYYRFFQPKGALSPEEVRHFCTVDHVDRSAYVGLVDGEIVGVARYERTGDDRAEAAFIVADEYQGLGLGTLLLERLAAAAWANGIRTFTAEVLADNLRMLEVFRTAGFGGSSHLEPGGTVHVDLDLTPTDELHAAVERRHETARRAGSEPPA